VRDLIVRAPRGAPPDIHERTGTYRPNPGRGVDGLGIYHVLGVPDGVWSNFVLARFGKIAGAAGRGEPSRHVWTWDDFMAGGPEGRVLTVDEAGAEAGLTHWTIKQRIREGKLPASYGGPRGRIEINEHDLRWWRENVRTPIGRPTRVGPWIRRRKPMGGGGSGESGGKPEGAE
jgi:hypothetical protein